MKIRSACFWKFKGVILEQGSHQPASAKPLVLVGMMGAGKSAVGKILAERLALPFTDSDNVIEKAAGKTIPEIFVQDGEAVFRTLEATIIAELLNTRQVIATGGGAVLNAVTRQLLKEKAVIFWLQARPETLFTRVRRDKNRPLLQNKNPQQTLRDVLEQRQVFYAEADFSISTDGHSPEEIASNIMKLCQPS